MRNENVRKRMKRKREREVLVKLSMFVTCELDIIAWEMETALIKSFYRESFV